MSHGVAKIKGIGRFAVLLRHQLSSGSGKEQSGSINLVRWRRNFNVAVTEKKSMQPVMTNGQVYPFVSN